MIIEPGITIPAGITITSTNTGGQDQYVGNVAAYGTATPTTITYTWTCPAGVTSVDVLCIGAGGSGSLGNSATYSTGGGAGGLGWKNNIAVTPGLGYTVVVGCGGPLADAVTGTYSGTDGGNSYFIDTSTVVGYGGQAGKNGGAGGSYVGDGGGAGGSGSYYGGGGGAGGYTNVGSNGDTGAAPYDGGGAAGGAGSTNYQLGNVLNLGGGGGGVGTLGQGTSAYTTAGGGSGGQAGVSDYNSVPAGGYYGGGGGRGNWTHGGGYGGAGAVRIMWGILRSFPSQNTGNIT